MALKTKRKAAGKTPPLVPTKSSSSAPPSPAILRELASAGWSFRVDGDALRVTPAVGNGPIRRIEADAIARNKPAIVERLRWEAGRSDLVVLAGELVGFTLRADGDCLIVTPAPTNPDVIEGLRRHKHAILRELELVGGVSGDAVDLVCERAAIIWESECPEEAQAALARFGIDDIVKAAPRAVRRDAGA